MESDDRYSASFRSPCRIVEASETPEGIPLAVASCRSDHEALEYGIDADETRWLLPPADFRLDVVGGPVALEAVSPERVGHLVVESHRFRRGGDGCDAEPHVRECAETKGAHRDTRYPSLQRPRHGAISGSSLPALSRSGRKFRFDDR